MRGIYYQLLTLFASPHRESEADEQDASARTLQACLARTIHANAVPASNAVTHTDALQLAESDYDDDAQHPSTSSLPQHAADTCEVCLLEPCSGVALVLADTRATALHADAVTAMENSWHICHSPISIEFRLFTTTLFVTS